MWLASGHTDTRRGMRGLRCKYRRDSAEIHSWRDVDHFGGCSRSLLKAPKHDGIGLLLYAKQLDRRKFIWP